MNFANSRSNCSPLCTLLGSRQSGAVLIVGLIMLLLMTIVGLAAIRGSSLQELMASNLRDRNLAFQAAEAGLRAGESRLRDTVVLPVFNGSVAGLQSDLNQPTKTPVVQWSAADWATGNNSVLASMDFDLASQPRYVIEKLEVSALEAAAAEGSGIDLASMDGAGVIPPEIYRTSSRGVGGTTDADVIVQSVYKR